MNGKEKPSEIMYEIKWHFFFFNRTKAVFGSGVQEKYVPSAEREKNVSMI